MENNWGSDTKKKKKITHQQKYQTPHTERAEWSDSSSHFYERPGFITASLMEWLAASGLCSYISMHYGRDKTPLYLERAAARSGAGSTASRCSSVWRRRRREKKKKPRAGIKWRKEEEGYKWILKPFGKYWEAANEICLAGWRCFFFFFNHKRGSSGGRWTVHHFKQVEKKENTVESF